MEPQPFPGRMEIVFTRQIDESHLLTSDLPGLRSRWHSRRGGDTAKISSEGLGKGRKDWFADIGGACSLPTHKFCSGEKHHFSKENRSFECNYQEPMLQVRLFFTPSHPFLFFVFTLFRLHMFGGRKSWGRTGLRALWLSTATVNNLPQVG